MDNTTLTTNCGHHTPVAVSDVYDLYKLPRVDMKPKRLLQCCRPAMLGKNWSKIICAAQMILSVSHPLRDKTTPRSRQLRVKAPLLTYISGASFSSSDAEDSTIPSEVWETQQLQGSCRAESFVMLRSEILGAFRHSSSAIGEQPVTGISSVQENEVFRTPFEQ